MYEQADAAGFIRLYGLSQRVRALKDQEAGKLKVAAESPADQQAAGGAQREALAIA